MEIEKGDRVRFLSHKAPDPNPLTPGEEGTVDWVSGKSVKPRQIGVKWDSGRTLMLLEDADRYEKVNTDGQD